MNKSLIILFLTLPILLFSCDDKKEPVLHNSYRISGIKCDKDNYRQTFEYYENGLIKRWGEHYDDNWDKTDIESSFKYDDDNNIIISSSDEFLSGTRRLFSDTLFLDDNGLALRAKGEVVIYHDYKNDDDHGYIMQKAYTADFKYDPLNQLIYIGTSEKNSDFPGWEEQKSLDWCVEMEWEDGNLVESGSYYSPSRRPMSKTTYSYYGGNSIEYFPILQTSKLRYFYLPLQYQGVFGKQSDGLVKGITFTNYGYNGESIGSSAFDYSYYISTSIHDSQIEAFSRVYQYNGEEQKYIVSWEPK